MNKKKSLITALLLVVVAGLSITAGTFAYFQWTTGTEGGTQVNVTIEMGGITMHIEPETTEFVGLYPTAHCENNVRYGDALVTIVNNTGTLAIPSFKLKVRVTDKDGNGVPKSALEHINYAVVPIKTTKDAQGNPVKGDTGSYSCSNVPVLDDAADSGNLLNNAPGTVDTSFNFENVSVNGGFTHVPSEGDLSLGGIASLSSGYLPRQYYIGDSETTGFYKGDVNGITFRGESYTTSYQYFRVYVWVDGGYTSTIVGNVVSDPLQNAKIEITWSEESMVQQVSGESNVESVRAAGLYQADGTFTSWDDLLIGGDSEGIAVEDSKIIAAANHLRGDLIIPDGIIAIMSFGSAAFTSVKIPSSVIEISPYLFMSDTWKHIYYDGTVEQFSLVDFSTIEVTVLEVECLDGEVPIHEPGLLDEHYNLHSNWDSLLEQNDITVVGTTITNVSSENWGVFVISEGITSIGDSAFVSANWLGEIMFANSVTTIGEYAFSGVPLVRVLFGKSSQLTTIRDFAFNATNISTIELPIGVTYIGAHAFDSQSSSVDIYYRGTIAEWNTIEKASAWDAGVSKVVCTDGTITLE